MALFIRKTKASEIKRYYNANKSLFVGKINGREKSLRPLAHLLGGARGALV